MNANVFTGKLVRLVTFDPVKHPEIWSKWGQDSEYTRLLEGGPVSLFTPKQIKDWMEKGEQEMHFFMIHTLEGDQPIGLIDLSGFNWVAGDCWVGIGLGVRDYWGKGYGSDAMDLILGYAFRQLRMQRVSLAVFEYNPRAIRSYEKCGFKSEGRARQAMKRDGRRWDLVFMGCLREEWEEERKKRET